MFSLPDLRFNLDVLRAQRIIGSFYLNYPQINEVRKSDYMAVTEELPVFV